MQSPDILAPRWLRMTNYMSYSGKHSYRFSFGLKTIKGLNLDNGDNNGTGKSAIFYAICWVLFGRLPVKGFLQDDVINWWADSCEVELDLESPEQKIRINRSKKEGKSSKLKLTINGQDITGDQAAVQGRLEEELRLDWHLFNVAVLLKRKSLISGLYDATPTARINILSQVINDEPFRYAAKLMGLEIAKWEREIASLGGQVMVYKESIDRSQAELNVTKDNISRESARVLAMESSVQKNNDALELEAMGLQDMMRRGPEGDATEIQKALAQVTSEVNALAQELSVLQFRLKGAPDLTSGNCTTCKQPISPAYLAQIQVELGQLRQREQEVRRYLAYQQKNQLELSQKHSAHINWPKEKAALQNRLENLQLRAYANREGIDNNLVIQYTNQCNILENQITRHQRELNEAQTALDSLQTKIDQHNIVRKAFTGEIRYMMIDSIRETLSYFANEDLKLLGRAGQSLAFSSEKGEKESFVIVPCYQEERIGLPSDGQDYRFSLAVTTGVIKTLQHLHPHRLGILMIDDPVGELDANGCRDAGILFKDLTDSIPVVMVTVPREVDFGDSSIIQVHFQDDKAWIVK